MSKPRISSKPSDVIKRSILVQLSVGVSLITIICSILGLISPIIAALFSEFSIFIAIILALIFHYDKKIEEQTSYFAHKIDSIQKPIEIFSKLNEINDGGRTINQFGNVIDSLYTLKNNEIILNMQLMSLELLTKSLLSGNDINQFSIMLSSTPQEVYLSINKFIELLPRDSIYQTVSCLHFWNEKTIGHPTSYLAKNIELSITNNIKFERVILVEKRFNQLQKNKKKIILNQRDYNLKSTNVDAKIYQLRDPQKFQNIGNYALCYLPNNQIIILDFKYNFFGGVPTFREVSYKSIVNLPTTSSGLDKANIQDLSDRFNRYFYDVDTISLDDYINGNH